MGRFAKLAALGCVGAGMFKTKAYSCVRRPDAAMTYLLTCARQSQWVRGGGHPVRRARGHVLEACPPVPNLCVDVLLQTNWEQE